MNREELLQHVPRCFGNDEREEQLENMSEGEALDFSITLCFAVAALKIFCLKENPYDIFAIEFLALAAKKHRDWRRLKRKKDIITASILWAFGITALVFYLIIAVGKRVFDEKEK